MRTGTEAGMETRAAVAEMETGTNGNGNEDGIGEDGREAKKRKKPHKRAVDAIQETWETWVEREKNVDRRGLVQ